MIGASVYNYGATTPGAHISGSATDPSQVLSSIDIPAGRVGRLGAIRLDDGTWSIGHRTGGMIRMPSAPAAWVAECLALIVERPGKELSYRRGCMWALYNPDGQIFNLTAGAVIVCVEGYDNIRCLAKWMEAALS